MTMKPSSETRKDFSDPERSANEAATHGELPAFEPLMLRGLTYVDALSAAKATGCAIRRNHWCAPVVIWNGSRAMLDDEGDLSPFTLASGDRGATDWEMVKHEECEH